MASTKKRAANRPPAPPEPRRERRALTHVGGKVEVRGPGRELFEVIRYALRVNNDEAHVRRHVHGFHSYPARLHPITAQRLIERLSAAGQCVLDPFCGSGTVLVEAVLQGRRAIGVDLNPLACALARFKTHVSDEAERAEWLAAAERITGLAEERRQARLGPSRPYAPHEREPYDPHILFELDGLSLGIAAEPEPLRSALGLMLSSILTKVSRSLGDSSGRTGPRRVASGFAIRTFASKVREVARQSAEFAALAGTSECRVVQGDARKLPGVGQRSVDLIVSSPPYPGVFDYLSHHQHRLHWLGFDARQLARGEIGSRRQLAKLPAAEAVRRWQNDFGAALGAMARALRPGQLAALVLADSALGQRPVFVDEEVEALASKLGLQVQAIGSQVRPHFHEPTRRAFGKRPRHEHLLLLQRSTTAER